MIASPLAHRDAQPGHVWVRECGLHMWAGMEPFVVEWPIDRIRIVEG